LEILDPRSKKTIPTATSLAGLGPGGPVALGGAGQAPSEAPGSVAINVAVETGATGDTGPPWPSGAWKIGFSIEKNREIM